jgi:hypothetical protein
MLFLEGSQYSYNSFVSLKSMKLEREKGRYILIDRIVNKFTSIFVIILVTNELKFKYYYDSKYKSIKLTQKL